MGVSSGSASVNGVDYTNAVLQWAGDTKQSFTLSRKAQRFQATVGVRDSVRVQFEARADDGRQLFRSRVLGLGESQTVDVPVDGVFRMTLSATGISKTWGYGVWAEAKLVAPSALAC
jgi:NPCBM/NEW2 domain